MVNFWILLSIWWIDFLFFSPIFLIPFVTSFLYLFVVSLPSVSFFLFSNFFFVHEFNFLTFHSHVNDSSSPLSFSPYSSFATVYGPALQNASQNNFEHSCRCTKIKLILHVLWVTYRDRMPKRLLSVIGSTGGSMVVGHRWKSITWWENLNDISIGTESSISFSATFPLPFLREKLRRLDWTWPNWTGNGRSCSGDSVHTLSASWCWKLEMGRTLQSL